MFLAFKIIIGFILTYFTIFIITIFVTKMFDRYRINKNKIDYIPKIENDTVAQSSKPSNMPTNKKWNNILGVWEEQ